MRLCFEYKNEGCEHFHRCGFLCGQSQKLRITACSKKKLKVTLVANREIHLPISSPLFAVRIAGKEKDSSDNLIFEKAAKGDIVVTRDYSLAERLVKNGINVLNDKGTRFTQENIKTYLEERELGLKLKTLGAVPKGKWDTYNRDDLQKFKQSLAAILA